MSGQGKYGLAWRTIDAQYFGVPQRRKRVFVVGYLGNWKSAAEVLFEPQVLRGDIEKGGIKGKAVAALTATGVGTCGADDNQAQAGHIIVMAHGQSGAEIQEGKSTTLNCNHEAPIILDDQGGGVMSVSVNKSGTLRSESHGNIPIVQSFEPGVMSRCGGHIYDNVSGCIRKEPGDNQMAIHINNTLRRLTPKECERLQYFPDDYTKIPYKGKAKEDCPDSPRYKAMGNSWAVPCARWIGERIQRVDDIINHKIIMEEKSK